MALTGILTSWKEAYWLGRERKYALSGYSLTFPPCLNEKLMKKLLCVLTEITIEVVENKNIYGFFGFINLDT